MRQHLRLGLRVAAIITLVCALLVVTAVMALRSDRFAELARTRSIEVIERATGARVTLDHFGFDWTDLTVEFAGLTLHGTEPVSAQPLLQAKSLRLTFPYTSLLRRSIAIHSVELARPRIHVLVAKDGTTNLPVKRERSFLRADLLSYRIGRFTTTNGVMEIDVAGTSVRHVPLNVEALNLNIAARYATDPARYLVQLSSDKVQWLHLLPFGALHMTAEVGRDRILMKEVMLRCGSSFFSAQGSVRDLFTPVAALRVQGVVVAADLAGFGVQSPLHAGTLPFSGTVNYTRASQWTFAGQLSGTDLGLDVRRNLFTHVSFHSQASVNASGIDLKNIRVLWGSAAAFGEAHLDHWRTWNVTAEVRHLDVNRMPGLWSSNASPFDADLQGPVHLHFSYPFTDASLRADAQLRIAAHAGGNPLSGEIAGSYAGSSQRLHIDSAILQGANSRIALTGSPEDAVAVHLESRNASELLPLLHVLPQSMIQHESQIDLAGSGIKFDGTVQDPVGLSQFTGNLRIQKFRVANEGIDSLEAHLSASAHHLSFDNATLAERSLQIKGTGSVDLFKWKATAASAVTFNGSFQGFALREYAARYTQLNLPTGNGIASGEVRLSGTAEELRGSMRVAVENLDTYGQRLNRAEAHVILDGLSLRVEDGRLQANAAVMHFAANYQHERADWRTGRLQVRLDSSGFPLQNFSPAQRWIPGLSGRMEIEGAAELLLTPGNVEAKSGGGHLALKAISIRDIQYGALALSVSARDGVASSSVSGELRGHPITGLATVTLKRGLPFTAKFVGSQLNPQTFRELLPVSSDTLGQVTASFDTTVSAVGKLEDLRHLQAVANISNLEAALKSSRTPELRGLQMHSQPFAIGFQDGVARIQNLKLTTREGSLGVDGTFALQGQPALDLKLLGNVSLQAFELFDPNVIADGQGALNAQLQGTAEKPLIEGSLTLMNGNFRLREVSTGLTNVNGTIRFNRTRATIQNLSGEAGGGHIAFMGFVNFGTGGPLAYNLSGEASTVRFRYANSLSVTGDAHLELTGTTTSGLLSGDVLVSRVVVNADTDVGGILALTAAHPRSPGSESLLSGLQMDVHIGNSANLQVGAALSRDLEATIDAHLRGSIDRPLLTGAIQADQGEIRIFGAKYTINRGEVTFANTNRIEPILNLDLQTITRGVTVNITVSGTLNKLNMNYRSDPPLQPRDIIALLTVGQTPGFAPNLPTSPTSSNDISALQAGANSMLGQSGSAGSGRMSKLFGITNIKIDPLVQGVANTPQSLLTIEQQVSQNVTVTYVTNLAQTSEQIFRFEYALNPRFSVVAVRDDNGEFGIDLLYKKRFK